MGFSRPDAVRETETPYLEALGSVCEHYDVDVRSRVVESETVRAAATVPTGAHGRSPHDSRIHYLTAGAGPPLLLLHGLSSTAAAWIPMLAALSEHFTVYAPDRPGRGLSTPVDYGATAVREFLVAYLVEFLDAIGIEETAVVGNSLGGFQTLALTADFPERVTGQCLVGAPAGLSRSLPFAARLLCLPVLGGWLMTRHRDETVAEARASLRQMDVADDGALPDVYFEPGLIGEALAGQHESLRTLVPALMSVWGVRRRGDLRAEVIGMETPTRFVWGAEDAFWPPAVGEAVVREMPAGELVVLEGHGHMPWLEPGDAAADATLAFLRDASPGSEG